jgi:3-oxoacyl-[acyl-carrier-protein] synthase-3
MPSGSADKPDSAAATSTGGTPGLFPQAGPWGLRVLGMGDAVPDRVVTNDDLTATMDTTDEWIRERTGISERRLGGTTSGLAIEASRKALDDANIDPATIEQVVLATSTPDHICPGTAPAVAQALGLKVGAVDVQAACSGWVYALILANGLLLQGVNRLLLIGADAMEKITDYSDRGTGILFGNGAAAAIVERDPAGGQLLSWDLGSSGAHYDIMYAEHGGVFTMEGREVFRQAVVAIQRTVQASLEAAGLQPEDIDLVIPHQANQRIVEAAWKRLDFSMDQTVIVLDRYGNTSAASIPMGLCEAEADGRLKPDSTVLFVGFGAGMAWGSAILRWS